MSLREIKKIQAHTNQLVPRTSINREIRKACIEAGSDFIFRVDAVEVIHEAAESYMIGVLQDATLCAVHSLR